MAIDLEKHGLQPYSQQSTDSLGSNNETSHDQEVEKQSMFSHPFSFNGRIRRLEFGISYIIFCLWSGAFSAAADESEGGAILYLLTFIPAYWFLLAQGCKRCHDRNNSGWYQIIPFYVLWMLFGDSDIGENDYGNNPKGINM